jgi:tRNA A-37 threonylcarbamoyl transferase component Bud32
MPDASAPVTAVYKDDARSRVERVGADDGRARVRKRFTYSPLKQRLTWWIGRHPAQLERRAARRLDRLGVPVARVESVRPAERSAGGGGFAVEVVTAWSGPSLQQALREASADGHARLLEAVVPLVEGLLKERVFFKDLKSSNIVMGPGAPGVLEPRLIDAGSARRGGSPAQRARMLAMLRRTCVADGAEAAEVAAILPG